MFSANSSQVSEDRLYVEDVFNTYVYAGSGSAQTITTGIDLAGKGGLIWSKGRTGTGNGHVQVDSARSNFDNFLNSDTNQAGVAFDFLDVSSTGFSFKGSAFNNSGVNYVSWTFRKAPKFFDVVTYTGNGVAGRQIAHSLGVAPGTIIVKQTNSSNSWIVYHRSIGANKAIFLEATNAASGNDPGYWNYTSPSDTTFTVGNYNSVNASGATYVAYLFAHDTTSDGIIQCGSYSGTGAAGNTISLGWEPQWLLVKNATSAGQEWGLFDNMRGLAANSSGGDAQLFANDSSAEGNSFYFAPTATGFSCEDGGARYNGSGSTYIYIAIRRGPMRTPTSGTSVYAPVIYTGTGSTGRGNVTGLVQSADALLQMPRAGSIAFVDRLRGFKLELGTWSTGAEDAAFSNQGVINVVNNNVLMNATGGLYTNWNVSSAAYVVQSFRRAPSFFDVVCWTASGGLFTSTTTGHSLGVVPELVITKSRSNSTNGWFVNYDFTSSNLKEMYLNTNDLASTYAYTAWAGVRFQPTSTQITFSNYGSGSTNVSYLFASCPGVSKVGSYTGNGSSQTINCGFAAGARFVMIKRTDSTGDWYVWDTARGIVAGNDPHLSLNTTAAEVTTDDSVDTDSSGFVVNQLSATNINVSSAQYIYMAVA